MFLTVGTGWSNRPRLDGAPGCPERDLVEPPTNNAGFTIAKVR
jgi:hypothetical protein